jgi:hypothetical protein
LISGTLRGAKPRLNRVRRRISLLQSVRFDKDERSLKLFAGIRKHGEIPYPRKFIRADGHRATC